jgi:hypothetical protein
VAGCILVQVYPCNTGIEQNRLDVSYCTCITSSTLLHPSQCTLVCATDDVINLWFKYLSHVCLQVTKSCLHAHALPAAGGASGGWPLILLYIFIIILKNNNIAHGCVLIRMRLEWHFHGTLEVVPMGVAPLLVLQQTESCSCWFMCLAVCIAGRFANSTVEFARARQ